MSPGVNYVTYKADCAHSTTIQVNPTNLSTIIAGECYPFQDGSAPVKRYFNCYCNDRDYCNSAQLAPPIALIVVSVSLVLKCIQ
ncbi:unnamed protein product [Caenorhabditis bovis]|uniref:Uncharacterized protein n=1 Tax=Caenorhabditis bovis TaxID=2654633 RepID=A0A8S1EDT5_9PELO|nr:unnamed protein product [Caenorhabditis bovis]